MTTNEYAALINGVAKFFTNNPEHCTCDTMGFTIDGHADYQRFLQASLSLTEFFRVGILLALRRDDRDPNVPLTINETVEIFKRFNSNPCMTGKHILVVLQELYGPQLNVSMHQESV